MFACPYKINASKVEIATLRATLKSLQLFGILDSDH